jgi:lipopolysaccharide export LptBFGC system permease protein LptF
LIHVRTRFPRPRSSRARAGTRSPARAQGLCRPARRHHRSTRHANAGILKNDAAIKKTEASNQWNYYQSKSSKQNLAELALELTPSEEQKARYRDKIARYEKEKADIKANAEKLEEESKHFDEKSEQQLHMHHRWAQATTALQVSIAVAAIALLTRRRWMEWATLVFGGIGCVLGALAALHI